INSVQTTVDGIQTQLDHIPPAWSQALPAAERFVLVLDDAAVLDKETGLVWEQSPNTTARAWLDAQIFCNQRVVGGRKGWRLPVVQELASLVDSTQSSPALPAGHPFTIVQLSNYWSATTFADNTSLAWVVLLDDGDVVDAFDKASNAFVWCVRGGQGVDPQ
ncbi:MAG: DUF1566 domain-containing protein, partial [Anaerolineales bacterium]